MKDYQEQAKKIRGYVLTMLYKGQSAHAGSNLSAVDIIAVLYKNILNIDPKNPEWEDRDRFIMSKGHGAAVVYAALALKGFFPISWLDTYYQDDGKLAGHITKMNVPGIEFSTGSLGHGLPFACGVALAGKRDKKKYRAFVIISDGEMDEGSNWEAFLFAPHHKLDNLIVIMDYNKIQSLASVKDTLNLEPVADKLKAFGWSVKEINGHNYKEIESMLTNIPAEKEKPLFVIANTIKGKGVSFMENTVEWHYKNLDEKLLDRAFNELNIKKEDFGL